MTTSLSAPDASRAIDGDVTTVWSTGRGQAANDSVTIELADANADAVSVAGVELQSGSNAQNYPVALRVELSEDGQRWSTAWEGLTADPRFATVLLEGVDGCRVTFAARPARFVRLTETVDDSARPWSIAEVSVLRGS